MDHLRRRTLRLSELNMMILDEADEMLNMGFKEDIETILKSVPEDRHHQTILFSATWPEAILKITQEFQDDPVKVEISSTQRTIDTIAQSYYEVPKGQKDLALEVLLEMYRPSLCMIFCNTKKMVDELSETLGKAFEPEQRFENPDGTDITFNTDYFHQHREGCSTLPGPLAEGGDSITLW